MLKLLSPIAHSGKLPVSTNTGVPLESLPGFGFVPRCPAVAGGGRGPGDADACIPLSSRSFAWSSPWRRAAGAWWGARWTAGSRRGRPGRGAPRRAVPAVSPLCPFSPTPQQCSADGTPSPSGAHAAPERGYRTQGSPRAAASASEVGF